MTDTPLNVLIVEDSEDDAQLLLRQLSAGKRTVHAERVQDRESLVEALNQAWDLVVSDYSMPGFRGTEALAIVRSVDPDVPFIFVSGTIGEETAVSAMRAGAQDYVLKENLTRLVPAVERELRDAATRREQRAATAMVHAIVDASPIPIIGMSADGTVRRWNAAAERVFGWSAEEVLGGSNPIIPDDAVAEADRERARVLASSSSVTGRPATRLRRDGTSIDVRESFGPTRGLGDEVDGMVVLVEDVTVRKALRAQLIQAQKLEAVARLAGGVAHDFNNLLTVIMGVSSLLVDELPAGDTRDGLSDIHEAALRAGHLTRQLLSLSRQEIVAPEVVDLNELVRNMEKMVGRVLGESIELSITLDPSVSPTKCDPGQLEQVLLNLVVNARDAMPSGGKLTIDTANVMVDAARARRDSLQSKPHVQLSVRDSGGGIPADVLPQIFEPFFTTKGPTSGTGLGLATCLMIVRAAGGHISVESTSGEGTRFIVLLPVVDATGSPQQPAELPSPRGTETILLVEDNGEVRTVTRRMLESLGYRVFDVPDGAAALELLRTRPREIDLLLSDLVLEGMSGLDVVQEAKGIRPSLRFLLASGYADETVRGHGVETVRVLRKPFTPEVLGRKVREILDEPAG